MIHEHASNTSTVRSVFIIDPRGIIRAILHYPQSIGRNITEIKRILIALQTSDAFQVVMPAEWIPGDAVIDIPPRTTHEIKTKEKDKSKNTNAWFMNFKQISPEMILEKITNQKLLKEEKYKKDKKDKKEKKHKYPKAAKTAVFFIPTHIIARPNRTGPGGEPHCPGRGCHSGSHSPSSKAKAN